MARKTLDVQVRTHGLLRIDSIDTRRQVAVAMAHSHYYAEAVDFFPELLAKESDQALSTPWAILCALACVAAADHRTADGLQYLKDAVDRGFNDADYLVADDDLKNLRGNARFESLVAGQRLKVPATQPY
jgi:hypothetical protein